MSSSTATRFTLADGRRRYSTLEPCLDFVSSSHSPSADWIIIPIAIHSATASYRRIDGDEKRLPSSHWLLLRSDDQRLPAAYWKLDRHAKRSSVAASDGSRSVSSLLKSSSADSISHQLLLRQLSSTTTTQPTPRRSCSPPTLNELLSKRNIKT